VAGNTLRNGIFRHFTAWPAAWNDSLDPENNAACLFHGGYLEDFLAAMQFWTDRGVRMFKFDFMEFDAAPAFIQSTCLPSEIWERNCEAYRVGLNSFRVRNPDVKLIAYNGLWEGGGKCSHETGSPFRKMVDTRWLEVFDSVYCGDPRPADVPCANFWRAKDIYSDHMVRYFESNGFPLSRIDNAGFMIGTTGTCYYRGKQAWRGMLVLSLARGGWANTYYGNLDLLTTGDARWFSKAQQMFLELQRTATVRTFGGIPGRAEPYGFWAHRGDTNVLTVVNPSQDVQTIQLPARAGWMLFRDSGFEPVIEDTLLTLGPEQVAVVASGRFAQKDFELGLEPDVLIPEGSEPVEAEVKLTADGKSLTVICAAPPKDRILRAIFRQSRGGRPLRTTGGAPPGGVSLGRLLHLNARQGDRDVSVRTDHDKVVWSGLSWVVGEIDGAGLDPVIPIKLVFSTTEAPPLDISAELMTISYGGTRVRRSAVQPA
jgi:hypothetical protein